MTRAHHAMQNVAKIDHIFEADEAQAFARSASDIFIRCRRLSVGASALYFDELMDAAENRQVVATILSAYVASAAYREMWTYLGRPECAAIPLHMCLLRTVDVGHVPAHVPFHQDVAFMTDAFPSMNCWVALDDCGPGFGVPSLEVLAAPVDRRLEIVPSEQRRFVYHRNIELDLDVLRTRYAAEAFWHPDFRTGDGILFNQYAPHRTYIEPGMQGERRSLEIRLCPAAALPAIAPWLPKVEVGNAGGRHELVLVDASGARRLFSVVETDS